MFYDDEKSQSHRTDLVNSDNGERLDLSHLCFGQVPSQSHRTDLVTSDHDLRLAGNHRVAESRNPTLLIWSIPTREAIERGTPYAAKSQSHRTDLVNSDIHLVVNLHMAWTESQSHRTDLVNSDRKFTRTVSRPNPSMVAIPPY